MVNSKKRVLNIYFDVVINKIGEYGELDNDFYTSKFWPARPNSTSRLNLVNYVALNKLNNVFEIENYVCQEFDETFKVGLQKFDFVIIHQNASKKTFGILRDLFTHLKVVKSNAKIIFGTEGTWHSPSTKEFLTEDMINSIYHDHLLLRHTPKTDRIYYSSPECKKLNIQEFELGIDTDLLSTGKCVSVRKYITFVEAPEGRVTKNNDLIKHIVDSLEQSNITEKYEIRILKPPYSSSEYWKLLSESAFFIITSNSETFSYCLNDAKALGAVTFYPTQMYCTKIGARFIVDNYPDSQFRFSSIEDLMQQIGVLTNDEALLAHESYKSRRFVLDNFSIDKVSQNWLDLLSENKKNKEKLYLYDISRDKRNHEDIKSYCLEKDIKFAMPYCNLDHFVWADDKFEVVDEGVIFLKHFLAFKAGKLTRAFFMNKDDQFRFGVGAKVNSEPKDETLCYLMLINRIHKIGEIIIDDSIGSSIVDEALKEMNIPYSVSTCNVI